MVRHLVHPVMAMYFDKQTDRQTEIERERQTNKQSCSSHKPASIAASTPLPLLPANNN